MIDCCTTDKTPHTDHNKHVCPVNGKSYSAVAIDTILHHINHPWRWQVAEQGYYFCDDPECSVVYFADDNSIIEKSSLRTRVGIKEQSDSALICYCFGVDKQTCKAHPQAKAFVIEQTKHHACSCTTSNPSGRCCLKDFSKS